MFIPMSSAPQQELSFSILERRHVFQDLRRNRPVLDRFVAPNAAVPKVDATLGKFGDVRFVRHHHDSEPIIVQFLEHLQNFEVRLSRLPVGSSASRIDG